MARLGKKEEERETDKGTERNEERRTFCRSSSSFNVVISCCNVCSASSKLPYE